MIIGLVGLIGSGKDTVAQQFIKTGCVKDSFATPLKRRLRRNFWLAP